MNIEGAAYAMAAGRVVIGLAPIVAAKTTSALLRFPVVHDNATARVMGRLFGVRDIGLGVLVAYAVGNPELLRWVFLFNAGTDAADALVIAPLLRESETRTAAILSLAFALGGGSLWLILRALM